MSSYRLRWKGQVTGPCTLEEIRARLASGDVSRMHQIEHGAQWRSLDEFLRETEEADRARSAERARNDELEHRRMEREAADERVRTAALEQQFVWMRGKQGRDREQLLEVPKRRTSNLAVAAFAVSFCSFIPYVNFVSWIPALILAHAALAEMDRDPSLEGRSLAQGAIILTSTFLVLGVLFLLAAAFGIVKGLPW
jgi:hypothetical protein